MQRPTITAATPRTLTHELMDLGLEPHVVATAVQIYGAMAADASGSVTVRVESEAHDVPAVHAHDEFRP